jgi:hypothetical protein
MEDFINEIPDTLLRLEILRLWKLYPKMPIHVRYGAIVIWHGLGIDLCRALAYTNVNTFLYFAQDEFSEQNFYQRLEQYK